MPIFRWSGLRLTLFATHDGTGRCRTLSMAEELSSYDIRLLEQLQKNAEQSTAELAEKVGLSQSPCWRRLQRLKEEGYIKSQVALLDRVKLGHELVIFSTFKMQTLSEEKRAEFLRKIELIPEIIECHTIFGEMDVLVKVIAPSMNWYQAFIFNTLMKLPGVTDIRSTVTLAEVKYTTQVPVRVRHGGQA
ncbi:MAG: AsnC family transcriptional regulator [Steroidobacteraceae bacterium]